MSSGELARLSVELEEAAADVKARVSRVVRASAHNIEAGAKSRAPVDTGNLRNSYLTRARAGEPYAEVINTANYAPYVEYGTSRGTPAQPSLGPATDHEAPAFYEAVQQAAGEGLS